MTTANPQSSRLWDLSRRQHGVVSRTQLLESGLTPAGIRHRTASGRLHPVARGVYAVGRPELGRHGIWMAALLACGPEAALSHRSAAAMWQIAALERGSIELSVPLAVVRARPGVALHRRVLTANEITQLEGIAVTTPARTLIDLALQLSRDRLEAAINEADRRDLVDPESLRATLGRLTGRPGVGVLRATLDRRTFRLTRSKLERLFLPITRRADLPAPVTNTRVNGFLVDFHWPDLALVVETDGLRYHRTPVQQARDVVRDQAHHAAGLVPLRFTHSQVAFEPAYVERTLRRTVEQVRRRSR